MLRRLRAWWAGPAPVVLPPLIETGHLAPADALLAAAIATAEDSGAWPARAAVNPWAFSMLARYLGLNMRVRWARGRRWSSFRLKFPCGTLTVERDDSLPAKKAQLRDRRDRLVREMLVSE